MVDRKKQQIGYLELITGCMFAGKTEEFIRKIKRMEYAGYAIQIFKPHVDNRYQYDKIMSHSMLQAPCQIAKGAKDLLALIKPDTEVVGIEEVQFFDPKIVDIIIRLVHDNTIIVVNGLDKDFRGQAFNNTLRLMVEAEKLIKLNAICMVCGQMADRTQRMVNNIPAKWDDPIVMIGASDKYEARCRFHHIIENKED